MKCVRLLLLTTAAGDGWHAQTKAQMFAPRPWAIRRPAVRFRGRNNRPVVVAQTPKAPSI